MLIGTLAHTHTRTYCPLDHAPPPAAYFTAVVLFDVVPMRVLPPTFFALFSYWMVGLHPSCATCILWFIGGCG